MALSGSLPQINLGVQGGFLARWSSGSVSRFQATDLGSISRLGKVDSTFYPYCSRSINENQASDHTPQHPMVTYTNEPNQVTGDTTLDVPLHHVHITMFERSEMICRGEMICENASINVAGVPPCQDIERPQSLRRYYTHALTDPLTCFTIGTRRST
ncbi:hypothetical protein TNCV_262471 [Trichonephila clavipes]|nr:hypothetical protein TNCV_262471 [Trichonephila clavipes]